MLQCELRKVGVAVLLFPIQIIVTLIVVGLIWWLIQMLPLPAPIMQIITVVLVLCPIFWLLGAFGLLSGTGLPLGRAVIR